MSIRTRILVGALGLAVTAGLVGGAAAQTPSSTADHSATTVSTKTVPAEAISGKTAKVHLVRHAKHVHVAHRVSHKHVAVRHLVKRHLAKHVYAKQRLAKRIALSHRV